VPRATTQPYREQVICKGCGTVFEAHTRTRDYCCGLCRVLRGATAGQMGTCLVCQSVWVEAAGQVQSEFVRQHAACRKDMLDRDGRRDDCLCGDCKRRKGVTTVQAVPPSARKRQGRTYTKHKKPVFERDDYVCQICQLPTDPGARPSDDRYPTLDHIWPIALGGDDEPDNLRTAHRWCNITLSNGGLGYDDLIREGAHKRFS
jgi:hypothetical protein